MNKSLLAAVATGLLSTADARMSLGACPDVKGMTTVDTEKYAGMWYLNQKDMMMPMMMTSECEYKRFTLDSNKDLDLWFGAYYDFKYTGINGKMYCTPDSDPSCQATMGDKGIESGKRSDIDILYTDYENYDIGYYCMEMIKEFGIVFKADVVLIYGREGNMPADKLEEARQIVREKVPDYALDW